MPRLLAIGLLGSMSLFGADFSGTWVAQIRVGDGAVQDIAIKLTQTGNRVQGKLYGDYESDPISEARVSGDLITFIVVNAQQNGNEINPTRSRFTGRLKDGSLDLTRERESSGTAGNGGSSPIKGATRQVIQFKRLF